MQEHIRERPILKNRFLVSGLLPYKMLTAGDPMHHRTNRFPQTNQRRFHIIGTGVSGV